MVLHDQMIIDSELSNQRVSKWFSATDDFHDANLNRFNHSDETSLEFEIRYPKWIFLNAAKFVDQLTVFRISLQSVKMTKHWGTEDNICKSVIINFSAERNFSSGAHEFKIMTGDGERIGWCDPIKSTVSLITTSEIYGILKSCSV